MKGIARHFPAENTLMEFHLPGISFTIRMLLLFTALLSAFAAAAPPPNYAHTAIARTIELGGTTTQVTTQYNVKALVDGPGAYHLALASRGDDVPAWWEVSLSGKAVEVDAVSSHESRRWGGTGCTG